MSKRMCLIDGCGMPTQGGGRGWCPKHYRRWQAHGTTADPQPFDPEAAFWKRVDRTDTCWLWTGSVTRRGYGSYVNSTWNTPIPHRIAWMLTRGPIPEGMTLDHVTERCGNKHCVNPEHMELVTALENHARWAKTITHCSRGHEFTEENTFTCRKGWRRCRTCVRASKAGQQERARRRRREGVTVPPDKHGTRTGYCYYNCRCEGCSRAQRDYDKAKRSNKVEQD